MASGLASNPSDERLARLHGSALDDPDLLARLDRLAALAATICDAPIALVSLVQDQRQIFLGRSGLAAVATPREHSFCAHAMLGSDRMVVPDARIDPRFSANPLVTGDPQIRFYAGQPLKDTQGAPLGSFCVIDRAPRDDLSEAQGVALATLAEAASALIEKWQADLRTRLAEDRSRRRIAELEQRFNVLADSLPQMVWSTPPDGLSDYFNRQWCQFTGEPEESSFNTGWMGFLHPEDVPVADRAWTTAVRSGEDYEVRYRLRRHDGHYRWVIARGLPIHNEQGQVIRWIGTCTDIHDEVETSEKLELLSQELTHRIKNIFAVIGGLVSLTARNNPEITPLSNELHGRILALGRAHDFVRPDTPDDGSELGKRSLKGMIVHLLEAYQSGATGRIAINGPDLAIDDRSATPLALFVHELATNSAKYGALSCSEGQVDIDIETGESVRLRWADHGGPRIDVATRSGFGSRLIEMSIGRQLGGTVDWDWDPAGLRVTATVPLASLCRD